MQDRHINDLVDAYILGALEPDEVDTVERHIETCTECSDLVRDARGTTDQLLYDVPQVAPPPSLRVRVLARIAAEHAEAREHREPLSNISSGTRNVSAVEPAIDLNAIQRPPLPAHNPFTRFFRIILGELPPDEHQAGDLLRELLTEPDCAIWPVAGTDDAPSASARLVGAPSRREAVLITNGLRHLPSEQAYQVWFLRGGQPTPNALFSVDRSGTGVSVVRAPQPLRGFELVAVTPEPSTGSPAPTGPIVLAGSIAEEPPKS